VRVGAELTHHHLRKRKVAAVVEAKGTGVDFSLTHVTYVLDVSRSFLDELQIRGV